jgi:hypothetical protein
MKFSNATATLFLMASSLTSAWKFTSDNEKVPIFGEENTHCDTVSHKRGDDRDLNYQDERSYYQWDRSYTQNGHRDSSRSCCLVLYDRKLCDGSVMERICGRQEAGYMKFIIKGMKVENCENGNNGGNGPPYNNPPYNNPPNNNPPYNSPPYNNPPYNNPPYSGRRCEWRGNRCESGEQCRGLQREQCERQ